MEGSTFLAAAVRARSEFWEESEVEATDASAAASREKCRPPDDLRDIVLGVLARFPEAFRAVRDALVQAHYAMDSGPSGVGP